MKNTKLPARRPICPDFEVWIDGEPASVYAVRVSAIPYNRRWPGRQRSEDQTELAGMVSFAALAPVCVRVRANRPFEKAVVKPSSRNVSPEREGDDLIFTLTQPGGYTVELDGPAKALHLWLEEETEYDLSGPVLRFGPGEHRVGTLTLQSGQTLFLERGAVLYGNIKAQDAEHIRILGPGLIDGSENREVILFETTGDGTRDVNNATREHTIHLERCRHVELAGFTVVDSLVYNVSAYECQDMKIRNLNILGCWRYNSDGIDLHNCRRCHIAGCFLRTYDDSICVKGHPGWDPICEDILVENCVIWNDWGRALEFGAETCADEIRRVTMRDCDIIRGTHVMLDVQSVDYADIHDILFEDIRVEYDETAPEPKIQNRDDQPYYPGDGAFLPMLLCAVIYRHGEYSQTDRAGKTHGVTFRHIAVTAPAMPPSLFQGFDEEHMVYDVLIENLTLNGRPVTDWEAANIAAGEFTRGILLR